VKDFFISYTHHDQAWAEWIAWQLEEHEFTVVIQAWDFVGNWVVKMDSAMREARRTIAVLSPHYIDAMFTQSEWADAFRRDPIGTSDLLIPVRIAPVELRGLLAQVVYIDLVGRSESEALDLLLKRVRGERGKPTASPQFPSGLSAESHAGRSTGVRPVYPAAAEDQQKFLQARDAVVRWRALYSDKIDALREAGTLARRWSRDRPSQTDNEIQVVISLADRVAQDFGNLPVRILEFARPYGLNIHPTVFLGQAINDVSSTAKNFAQENKKGEKVNAIRVQQGMNAFFSYLPDNYGFEMIARVLESAVELVRFNLEKLPQGYLKPSSSEIPGDLRRYQTLLVARIDADARLHLVSPDPEIKILGSFSARALDLHVLCAQRNRQGSIDLVAHDFEHSYYWQSSSQLPTMQFTREKTINDARFLSWEAGSAVATIDSYGTVQTITPAGTKKTLYRGREQESFDDALIWVDPVDQGAWYALWLSEGAVSSGLHGVPSSTRTPEDLWDDPFLLAEFGPWSKFYGPGRDSMFLGKLDGISCLMVTRRASWGRGGCFLDPRSLLSIRRPLGIREFVGDLTIANGRWLVAVGLQSGGEPHNHLFVWDLDSNNNSPIGGWFEQKGDVYEPVVTAETGDSFETVQVFHDFTSASNEKVLVRFEWPSGEITKIQKFQHLRIWPVELQIEL
jgi:hypothetical protein